LILDSCRIFPEPTWRFNLKEVYVDDYKKRDTSGVMSAGTCWKQLLQLKASGVLTDKWSEEVRDKNEY